MEDALLRMASCGASPRTIIDLGAARGDWSRLAQRVFPESRFLLVEPLEEHESELREFCCGAAGSSYLLAAAGNKKGTARIHVAPDLDGSGFYGSECPNPTREIHIIRLDQEIERLSLRGPYLMKFDTHGFELPILEGASTLLSQTELVVMECYNFPVSPTSVYFWEMCRHLRNLGFRPADMASPLARIHDKLWWQVDFLFLRENHPAFAHLGYR